MRPPHRIRRPRNAAAALSVCALLTTMIAALPAAQAGIGPSSVPDRKVEAAVAHALADGEKVDFWVRFHSEADTGPATAIDDWGDRGAFVVDELQAAAQTAQAHAREILDGRKIDYESFWITNAIFVRQGDQALADELAALKTVEQVSEPRTYELPEPIDAKPGGASPNAIEWGVVNVNAYDVWSQYGITGEGIVVANIDTGVEYDHPALVASYRGNDGSGNFDHNYNWFDASGSSPEPVDNNGSSHGTHTMGTMVGSDGAANQIGVAPGATWIAANGCATCSDVDLVASGQWLLAPTDLKGQNADPAKRPHIVNNSWGTVSPSTDPFMEDVLTEWANAGIFGVWSNGNNGSACETSGSPGSRTLNYSVAAYDSTNTIADFSSRGPGQDGEIKPNIAAPGVDVRSAVGGGEYGLLSGTSMAAPHVAGVIALLWSAAPKMVGDIAATRALLDKTAADMPADECGGTAADNNVWGEGRLDALALIAAAPVEEAPPPPRDQRED